jgi:nucleoside diphosphate kinase
LFVHCYKVIKRTIWNGKPDKVKRNTLIGDFEKGGLKMIDIESYLISLKASWVSRNVFRTNGQSDQNREFDTMWRVPDNLLHVFFKH